MTTEETTTAPPPQQAPQPRPVHGAVNATGDETVRCLQCQRPTDWRDRLYAPSANGLLCKACQRWQERRTLRGYPLPPSALPQAPQHHGAARTLALTEQYRRRGSRGASDPRLPDKHPPQRWTAQAKRRKVA